MAFASKPILCSMRKNWSGCCMQSCALTSEQYCYQVVTTLFKQQALTTLSKQYSSWLSNEQYLSQHVETIVNSIPCCKFCEQCCCPDYILSLGVEQLVRTGGTAMNMLQQVVQTLLTSTQVFSKQACFHPSDSRNPRMLANTHDIWTNKDASNCWHTCRVHQNNCDT